MQTIKLESWEHFETQMSSLFQETKKLRAGTRLHVSDMLFRGQSDSSWNLQTTLERYSPDHLVVKEYYRCIAAAKNQIEAHTGREWIIPTPTDYATWVDSQKPFGLFSLLGYDYVVHLRHFGFPSPLLDWTRSPYVAAFFAFFGCSEHSDKDVAIYAYQEYIGHAKSGWSGEPRIFAHGPLVRSHKRHFIQQSEYTICAAEIEGKWTYTPHETAITKRDNFQDIFRKFTLPASERLKVLQVLDRYNLNAYSLFGSEESLMQTVALRELIFRNKDFT
jgi:hypothetical protein